MNKSKVGIFFGGQGGEHALSCLSAIGVFENLDRTRYEPFPVGISESGKMLLIPPDHRFWHTEEAFPRIDAEFEADELVLSTDSESTFWYRRVDAKRIEPLARPDVVLIILHGTYGEDGSIQGLLDFCGIKYVGAGILGSAVSLDKEFTKIILNSAKISTVAYQLADRIDPDLLVFPVFVKAATGGSSVGIERVDSLGDLAAAVERVQKYCPKVLIENAVTGTEVECAIREDSSGPLAATPGEILLEPGRWYDYDAKFVAKVATRIPAHLPPAQLQACQALAIRAFQALNLRGMARVDMFVLANGQILVNEVNTIPGFHEISMYPQMWATDGLTYPNLLTKLIEFRLAEPLK
jgi:D-alanine-D-alanine ligase